MLPSLYDAPNIVLLCPDLGVKARGEAGEPGEPGEWSRCADASPDSFAACGVKR
jgi:hypothetical protein